VLVRRVRQHFAAGGKSTQVANKGQFGKNHFDFGKNQRFSFVEFRKCASWGKLIK